LTHLLKQFIQFFKERNLVAAQPFLVAVSGGIDSVVLCELCRQAGFSFAMAHCNFGLRGEESKRDESFVRGLGEKYGVEVFVQHFDTACFATETKLSIQEAARVLRYKWFDELRSEKVFSYTLLAHHADDNIETLLMNFFRGTGLDGLAGMNVFTPPGTCVRPMLSFSKENIKAFAEEHKLEWVEDSSNASSKYTRNFFRNELIPQIKKVYPQVEANLSDNVQRVSKVNTLYQKLVSDFKKKLCRYEKDEVRIPIKQLMEYAHTSLIFEIIRDYGFTEKQVDEVIKLSRSDSGKFIDNGTYRFIRPRAWFIITKSRSTGETIAIDDTEDLIHFEQGVIEIKKIKADKVKINADAFIAQLDAKDIQFPLVLRKWKNGDYFYPLGMKKKKKVARFLIDQKVVKHQKESVYVRESNKKILWVVGMRIDDRFKVSKSTQQILSFTYKHQVLA